MHSVQLHKSIEEASFKSLSSTYHCKKNEDLQRTKQRTKGQNILKKDFLQSNKEDPSAGTRVDFLAVLGMVCAD